MTDNDIIKALKKLLKLMLCDGDLQRASTISKTIDFINRQNAEIEKLNHIVDVNKKVKAEAVKEFAERLKDTAVARLDFNGSTYFAVGLHHLDDLIEEFTEGE